MSKTFLIPVVTYDNSVSVAKSTDKSDFRLGVNNQKQLGTVPNSEVNKTNFSVNSNFQISENIKVGVTCKLYCY